MRRRDFIQGIVGSAAAWPLAARAQQGESVRRIGVLMNRAESDPQGQARVAAFKETMQQLGWTEGRNVQIDVRLGEDDFDLEQKNAAQLIALAPQANYTLANDIDLMATQAGGDVWSTAGFIPVNLNGSFDGGGYTISNLYEDDAANTGGYGLFRSIRGTATVDDLVIDAANITGANNVGALAGANYGTIQNVLSSEERLRRMVMDIMADMEDKPHLADKRGNALLVVDSISQACKVYRLFQGAGFRECA